MTTTTKLISALAVTAALLFGSSASQAAPTLTCLGERATIVGTEGDDSIAGTNGDDVIVALGGNDMINARDGDDIVCAGDGNDRIDGGDGLFADVIEGGPGDDWINGGEAMLTVASYDDAAGPVTVDLSAGTATGDGNDTLVGVNSVLGSENDDVIKGDKDLNFLFGGGGNDQIFGGGYVDLISGDAGDDILDGGMGRDTVSYYDAPNGVAVNLSTGKAGGFGHDRLAHIEDVDGSKYADKLTGAWNSNLLEGNGGADKLVGLGGNDLLKGDSGRDFADGGKGRDRCSAERRVRCP